MIRAIALDGVPSARDNEPVSASTGHRPGPLATVQRSAPVYARVYNTWINVEPGRVVARAIAWWRTA